MKTNRLAVVIGAALATTTVLLVPTGATAAAAPVKVPTAIGTGGAVSTVDANATAVGLRVLRNGGNAVDAAVAAAATLGVTEPYSAGIGGGGFFVYYDAATKKVHTIDGRERAPSAFTKDTLTENGVPIPFAEAVTSGLSNGVPGTPATWANALRQWGTLSLAEALVPARRVARNGFVVDQTFYDQTAANADRFKDFTSTKALFLPGGVPPAVGSTFRNPDLAMTYFKLGQQGTSAFYGGPIGADIVQTTQDPPVDPASTRNVRPGLMTLADLRAYRAPNRAPTRVVYRGLGVYGMAPPSSGGSTVGEALNILENFNLKAMDDTQFFHHYLESTKFAFADRNRWVGDPDHVNVPLNQLLSKGFARERACLISPTSAAVAPVAPGSPDGVYDACTARGTARPEGNEGKSTTNLTVADKWGNVVEYTLTIEQTGGSGITVPGRGFLLNNELTDFNFGPDPTNTDPNLPAAGKRPRSSMAPTIVLRNGKPFLAVGSPGGATIITTVLQILIGRLDGGLTLPQALAAPRASQRNSSSSQAEPAFIAAPYVAGLQALGHLFTVPTPNPPGEIGAATGIEFLRDGRLLAAAEPNRRGGGAAGVVNRR